MIDILTALVPQIYASSPTTEEIDEAQEWASEKSNIENSEPLFSFIYGGQSSGEILKTWDVERGGRGT